MFVFLAVMIPRLFLPVKLIKRTWSHLVSPYRDFCPVAKTFLLVANKLRTSNNTNLPNIRRYAGYMYPAYLLFFVMLDPL